MQVSDADVFLVPKRWTASSGIEELPVSFDSATGMEIVVSVLVIGTTGAAAADWPVFDSGVTA